MPSQNADQTPIVVETLVCPSADVVAAIVDIYEEAIPAAERRSTRALVETFASPRCRILVAERAGAVAGFAILYLGAEVALLEYLAVHRDFRSHGVGSLLCRAVQAASRDASGLIPLLAEVDADDVEASDLEVRVRRKGFYRRHGFRELQGFRYTLPLPGANPADHLHVLVSGYAQADVPSETVRAWLTEIYTAVYRTAPDDPRLAAMLNRAGASLHLA